MYNNQQIKKILEKYGLQEVRQVIGSKYLQ